MSNSIITKVVGEMNELSDDLQQQVLELVELFDSSTWQPLAMPGISSNLSRVPSKPQLIGQPSMTIISTAPPIAGSRILSLKKDTNPLKLDK